MGDEEEGEANSGHEQCGNEGEDKGLVVLYEIGRYGPQSEHGKCLVCPTEIFPHGVEAVGIAYLPEKQYKTGSEHRNDDCKSLVY